ncbi:hypothetical protein D3C80_1674170 [compost metagenome]
MKKIEQSLILAGQLKLHFKAKDIQLKRIDMVDKIPDKAAHIELIHHRHPLEGLILHQTLIGLAQLRLRGFHLPRQLTDT